MGGTQSEAEQQEFGGEDRIRTKVLPTMVGTVMGREEFQCFFSPSGC